jgi:hypothetical protein
VPWQNTVTTDTTDWDVANASGTTQFTVNEEEKVRFIATGASTVSFSNTDQSITYSSVNTWQVNEVNQDGYVPAPGVSTANKVWKTNGSGVPAWRVDEQGLTSVNLGATHNASTVVVTNTGGTDATINAATTSNAGVMSSTDKTKLNGIATSAEVNQNAFSTFELGTYTSSGGGTDITANSKSTEMKLFFWAEQFTTAVNNSTKVGTVKLQSDQRSQIRKMGTIGTGNMTIDASSTGYIYFDSHSGASDTTGTHELRFSAGGQIDADGDIIAFSSATASDAKLKTNVNKVENALDKVSQLDGVTFEWIRDGKESAGVIAQNVEEVLPSAVKEVESLKVEGETHKSVDYNQLSALFIEAIKELKEENKSLRDEIQKLINKE